MQEESNRITVGFHFVDTLGNTYNSDSTVEVFYSLDENELDVIGRQLNAFLRQCGYYRDKDLIFMEAIDEEEYDAIASFLAQRREGSGTDED